MSHPSGTTPLDFDRSQFSSSSATGVSQAANAACSSCSCGLGSVYYTLGDQMLCERCHFQKRDAGPPGSMLTRALGALSLGGVAAVVAGALWMLVSELTGYEIGLIAIVVGLMVGAAVRIGARGVGGVGYQLLAVFLTYSAIVMTYVPGIVEELRANDEMMADFAAAAAEADEAALAVPAIADGTGEIAEAEAVALDEGAVTATLYILSVPIAYAAPFLMGFENLIGVAIIGFALYEAWKINKRVALELKGPFRLGVDKAPAG